jgi:hypothetical protein
MPSCIKRFSISHRFFVWKLHVSDKSCWKMYTIVSRCCVNREKVTSWRLLVTPLAALSIIKQVRHCSKYGGQKNSDDHVLAYSYWNSPLLFYFIPLSLLTLLALNKPWSFIDRKWRWDKTKQSQGECNQPAPSGLRMNIQLLVLFIVLFRQC